MVDIALLSCGMLSDSTLKYLMYVTVFRIYHTMCHYIQLVISGDSSCTESGELRTVLNVMNEITRTMRLPKALG